ncbi:MAG: hypothetical protein JW703_01720 [Candidatus Diapherotrites archaeon]|nr:hypothetical protein [Candidatus Diapherotrites archaeon]
MSKGYVFGKHWHEKTRKNVPIDRRDWDLAEISRKENFFTKKSEIVISSKYGGYPVDNSSLRSVTFGVRFPLRKYARELVQSSKGRKPVILDWGCGNGKAISQLTSDPLIKGKALCFGYGNMWYPQWNEIDGVKFIFKLKEHLPEYFKRNHLKIDLIYSHAGYEQWINSEEKIEHFLALSSVMKKGGRILLQYGLFSKSQLQRLSKEYEITKLKMRTKGIKSACKRYIFTKK